MTCKRDAITKRKLHDNFFDDPWEKGQVLFQKKDVMKLRCSAAERRKKKLQIRECIINAVSTDNEIKTAV